MDLLKELSLFKQALKEYKNLLGQLSLNQPLPDGYQSKRESLLVASSHLVPQIKRLTNRDESLEIYEFGKPRTRNMWEMGLRNEYDYRTVEAIDACIDNVTVAIGRLKSDISMDVRDTQGKPITSRDKPFEKPIEVILIGTPSTILPVIETVATELHFQNKYYSARWHGRNMLPEFARLSIFVVEESVDPAKRIANIAPSELIHPIGVITLQALANGNQTWFRVPPYDQWDISSDFDTDGSYFTHLLEKLFAEFKRLKFMETKRQKTWRWFNRIVELWNKLKP